jgi:hypothetical protein
MKNRRTLIALVIALGLLGSTAATQCDPQTPAAGHSPSPAAGHSVVRCQGHRSCAVTLRRATTHLYAGHLHGFTSEAVADVVVDTVACALLRGNLAVAVACSGLVAVFSSHVITKLKAADTQHACLRLVFSAPAGGIHWKPISARTYNGTDCVN